jgi:LuxR family maltose regulon positive regulatory protein
MREPHAPDAPGAAPPLVRTRLAPPEPLPDTLRRPRLTARLAEAARRRLTLLSAPAGYGKTALLAEWLAGPAGHAPPAAAWLSLDASDNDPARLLAYMGAALARLLPGRRPAPLARGPVPPAELVLADMLNDLAEASVESVIVLDDYHLITAPAIHRALAFLVEHLPPRAHVVIATRADPPLPLARLRARGHLAEIRAPELSFTPEESAAFLLETMGLALSRAQVAALIERTEGWPAGLQLTASALRDRADPAAFVDTALGSHRYIVDYLVEDVFSRLAPHIQKFLLQTSVLDRLCGPLCDALLGIEHDPAGGDSYSRLILEAVERENLFLVALDGDRHWYRYHHLFGAMLRERLAAGAPPEHAALLHRRASAWYAAHGMLATAVDHALQAGAVDDVVAIVEPVGLAMATRVGEATLRAWLPAIPEATLRARPRLALLRAWLCLADYDAAGAGAWLAVAEAALARVSSGDAEPIGNVANLRGELCAVRARLATLTGDAPTVIAAASEALALLQADSLALRTRLAKDLGYAHVAQGDLAGAERAFAQAMVAGFVAGYPYISFMAASDYAYVQAIQGRLRAAAEACRELIAHAARRDELGGPGSGLPYLALADVCRERREPAGALPALAEAAARITPGNTTGFICLMVVEARVARAQGDLAGALAHVRHARFIAQRRGIAWALAVLDALEAQALIARGDLAGADRLLAQAAAAPEPAEFRFFPPAVAFAAEHCAAAPLQLRLARARGDQAALRELAAALEDHVAAADAGPALWPRVKLRVVQALALHGAGREQPARAVLRRALALAAPDGMVEVIAEEPGPLRELLAPLADGDPGDPAAAHARRVLGALEPAVAPRAAPGNAPRPAPAEAQPLPEPLSARELEVLRLMAEGQSNSEIAAVLVIAVSTVKSHVNSIFGKLGVATRTQAVVRARRLGLI